MMDEIGLQFVAEGADAFRREVGDANKAVSGFGDTLDSTPAKASVMQGALTGAFTAIAGAAIEMAAEAGRAVAGFVTDSIGSASEFETGLSVLQAASGATEAEMQALRDTSIALGNDITLPATSAQSAAAAMTELVKAGLSVKDSQDAARGALQLATAAQVDEATAAQIVAAALNTFNLSGDKAVDVADMLAAGANASAASATDLADGFKQAGFMFNSSNQDADDLITALSMLTNVGLTGSDAGTALKNAMMKLNAPTKEGAALMEALGINVFDAQGKMKPFNEVIDIFNKGMAGMTEEQRNAALATILQSDGMKAFLPLMDAGKAGFDEMNAKINENGAAAKMAGAQTEGFAGAQAALANTLDTLQLIIGTALLPILTDLLNNYVIPGVQWVMGLVDSFIKAGASGQGLGDMLAGVIPGFDGVMGAIDVIIPLVQTMLAAFDAVFNGIRSVVEAVLTQVALFIAAHGAEIEALFAEVWGLIQEIIRVAAAYYEKVVAPALQQVAKFINDHSAEIQAIFTTAWNVISTVVRTAINLVRTILTVAMKLINGDIDGALEYVKRAFISVWETISSTVQGIIEGLRNAISTKLGEIGSSISGAFTSALEAVRGTLNSWLELGRGIIDSIISGISNSVNQLVNTLREAVLSAFNSALSIFPAPIAAAIRQFLGISGNTAQRVSASATSPFFSGDAGGKSYTTAFNLSVNSGQSTGSIRSDFAIMRALAA